MTKISFTEEEQKSYIEKGLNKIIPLEIALRIKEVLDNENISDEYINNIVYNPKNYFTEKSNKGIRCYGISNSYEFNTNNKKAFGNWVLMLNKIRIERPYLLNKKSRKFVWLSDFEAYCLISEYRNAYFNSLRLNVDGTSNPMPFNKEIGYYNWY